MKCNSIVTIYSKFVFSECYYAEGVLYRSDVWWNAVVMRTFTHQDWLENFRMCKDAFMYICNKLSPTLRGTDTVLRRALSVERRVAVTLWCLAIPTEYRTIVHLFGIAHSTVCGNMPMYFRCSDGGLY